MGLFTVGLEQADSEARPPQVVLTPNPQLLPPAPHWEWWHWVSSCPQGAAEGTVGSWRHWGSLGAHGLQWAVGVLCPHLAWEQVEKKPQANCRRRRMTMKGNVAFVGLCLQSAGKGLSVEEGMRGG